MLNEIISLLQTKSPIIVGISGIDGAGKGFHAEIIKKELIQTGIRTEIINIDGWLTHPNKRFNADQPGEHFYHYGIDLDLFNHDVLSPFMEHKVIDKHFYQFNASNSDTPTLKHIHLHNLDVLIVEGIFIFKQAASLNFDYKIWIDIDKKTALERAITRNQEGLSEQELRNDFKNIYFQAQNIHFEIDQPKKQANHTINNNLTIR